MARRNHTLSEKWFLDVNELTDSSGGTSDGTVEAVPSDTLVNVAAAANNNFAELTDKVNTLIDRLKADV